MGYLGNYKFSGKIGQSIKYMQDFALSHSLMDISNIRLHTRFPKSIMCKQVWVFIVAIRSNRCRQVTVVPMTFTSAALLKINTDPSVT